MDLFVRPVNPSLQDIRIGHAVTQHVPDSRSGKMLYHRSSPTSSGSLRAQMSIFWGTGSGNGSEAYEALRRRKSLPAGSNENLSASLIRARCLSDFLSAERR